jgi:coenzyme PQQ synthesis protein D (PqqD)
MAATDPTDEAILGSRASVPEHVVHRAFPEETIVLNLRSGTYHGLNATAGRMLDALGADGTVGDAAGRLAEDLAAPPGTVREDVVALCRLLLERDLIELHEPGGG